MVTRISIDELVYAFHQSDFLWIIIPIFFIGIITDKYQEEFGTSVGNAISNGALIIFTGFSWLQLISSRDEFPIDLLVSQYIFAFLIVIYGFTIIASGFKTGEFAQKYGRIRVVTFMLIFFTMMIYVPILYNYVSILLFVLLFPFYYAFITELIKALPSAGRSSRGLLGDIDDSIRKNKSIISSKEDDFFSYAGKKLKEYLE